MSMNYNQRALIWFQSQLSSSNRLEMTFISAHFKGMVTAVSYFSDAHFIFRRLLVIFQTPLVTSLVLQVTPQRPQMTITFLGPQITSLKPKNMPNQ